MILFLVCSLSLELHFASRPSQDAGPSTNETPVAALEREARALDSLVTSRLAQNFLKATANLPVVSPRTIYLDEAQKTYRNQAAALSLSPDEQKKLKRIALDESFYFNTKYGSPLAYARPLEVLGRSGLDDVSRLKILDFGYGTIGHLRLLAAQGAQVTGVDVDPLLRALYCEPGDQGLVKNPQGPDGRLRLINGRFPADLNIKAAVAGDYDLILSKNTLKKGYVHPEQPVEPRQLLNLGVDDATFVAALHQALKPGGRVLIYNISPAPVRPANPTSTGPTDAAPSPGTCGKQPASASSPSTRMIRKQSGQSATCWVGTMAIQQSTSGPTRLRSIRSWKNRRGTELKAISSMIAAPRRGHFSLELLNPIEDDVRSRPAWFGGIQGSEQIFSRAPAELKRNVRSDFG